MNALDDNAFDAFAREQVHSRVLHTAQACVLLFGGAWVVGRVLLRDHPLEGPGRFWLGVLGATSACAWAAFRWLPSTRQHPAVFALAFHVVIAACAGIHSARMGNLNSPFFYGVYILPPLSIGLTLAFRPRICMTVAGPLAWSVAYFATHPSALHHRMIHVPSIIVTGCVTVSIYLGHQLHLAVRDRFLLGRRLERQQQELARHAAALEEEVEEGSRAVEHLSRVLASSSLEREDVARALHDDLGQLIVGVRMELEILERKLARLSDPGEPRLEHLATVVETLDSSVRTFIDRVRDPKPVDDLGESLDELLTPLRERSDLRIATAVQLTHPIDATLREVLYRLVQEAMTNVFKHAQATCVDIAITEAEGRIVARVTDDGVGFPSTAEAGLGLHGLRERARALGGTLIANGEGPGTVVELSVPTAHPTREAAQ